MQANQFEMRHGKNNGFTFVIVVIAWQQANRVVLLVIGQANSAPGSRKFEDANLSNYLDIWLHAVADSSNMIRVVDSLMVLTEACRSQRTMS